MKYYLLIFILIFCGVHRAEARRADTMSVRFDMFTIQDGLSQGLVMAVMQDKEGFLWFSTKDGLNKYDGYRVTVYRNDPHDPYSLPDNYVTQIVEDSAGNFWVGTDTKGLFLFDKKQERFFKVTLTGEENQVSHEGIWTLRRQGNILLVARPQYVYLYDIGACLGDMKNAVRALRLPSPVLTLQTVQIAQEYSLFCSFMPDNTLWVSGRDSLKVYRQPAAGGRYEQVQAYSQEALQMTDRLGEYSIYALPNPAHKVCIGRGKLVIYDFSAQKKIKEQTISEGVLSVRELTLRDNQQNYWLISDNTVSYYLHTTTYELTPMLCRGPMESINKGYTHCFDRNNRLWLGTTGHGVMNYDYRKNLFHTFRNPHGFFFTNYKEDQMLGINLDDEPALYSLSSGAYTAILPRGYWKKQWRLMSIIDADENRYILLIFDMKTAEKHLMSYDTKTHARIMIPYPYSATWGVQNFMKDNQGGVWLKGCDKQGKPFIYKIHTPTLSAVKFYYFPALKEESEYPFVSAFLQDKANVFWFATLQGLYSFDEQRQQWRHFTNNPRDEHSLPPNMLFSICADPKDPDKYLWIGSNGKGLSRFEIATGKCQHLTERDGLPNSVVYGLATDNAGSIWCSTNNGLSCLRIQQQSHTAWGKADIVNFTTADGLPGNEYNRYEVLKRANGDLIFGGTEGKVMFRPQEVLQSDPPPTIVISRAAIFNKLLSHKIDSGVLTSNVSYAPRITLTRQQSMLTLFFAALDYASPHKKNYRYILEGYDAQWVESGTKNEATYTNLPPGTYTFRVIGAVSGGAWNMTGARIEIVILPEWWQTWWFQSLAVLAGIISLYSMVRYRFYQKMKVYTLRNRIASDLHDEIGSTLSSVSLATLVLQKKITETTPDVQFLLSQINQNTISMMESMSDIVWAINTQNDSLENVIHRMRAFTSEILEPKNCNVHFEVESKIYSIALNMGQRKNLYLIFKEAVNNMAKYANCSNARISITAKDKRIVMTIKDDGVGFDLQQDASQRRLSGNGLKNMQKRAEELQGKLFIRSEKIQGTEIILDFSL
ncbi:MAG: two-component regulator propeller domain-containing protein [Candidatus Kapaibacterium sp.]